MIGEQPERLATSRLWLLPNPSGLQARYQLAEMAVLYNISQPTALVKTRLKRMQYRPGLLEGFLASTRLDLTPFRNSHQ